MFVIVFWNLRAVAPKMVRLITVVSFLHHRIKFIKTFFMQKSMKFVSGNSLYFKIFFKKQFQSESF